ncbi:hypothetical protein HK100_003859 [Physocladia obscura]|uniref:Uncharacterized protein n=1 Tax=Physocladia obscura TaxID=109957 RepID=A0AAD5TB31_9FUNG|nr:hypothetical protein HK100_003859 [Physocladia obscura]
MIQTRHLQLVIQKSSPTKTFFSIVKNSDSRGSKEPYMPQQKFPTFSVLSTPTTPVQWYTDTLQSGEDSVCSKSPDLFYISSSSSQDTHLEEEINANSNHGFNSANYVQLLSSTEHSASSANSISLDGGIDSKTKVQDICTDQVSKNNLTAPKFLHQGIIQSTQAPECALSEDLSQECNEFLDYDAVLDIISKTIRGERMGSIDPRTVAIDSWRKTESSAIESEVGTDLNQPSRPSMIDALDILFEITDSVLDSNVGKVAVSVGILSMAGYAAYEITRTVSKRR